MSTLAMKPFCSGSRDDAKLLFELSDREMPMDVLNPFHFRLPLAPAIAARLARQKVSLRDTISAIRKVQKNCEVLLIEGAGGFFVPLGERFMVSDLILRLRCSVLLVARNGIGVINHVLLSTSAIRRHANVHTTVVLTRRPNADISSSSNSRVLRELLGRTPIFDVPVLGGDLQRVDVIRRQSKSCGRLLTKISMASIFRRVT